MIESEEKVHCMQGGHMVPKSEMSSLSLPNGTRRRMCSLCKNNALDRRSAEKSKGVKK